MDYQQIPFTKMKLKTILKFDTGADGFKAMMLVLAFFALCTLLAGIYFLVFMFNEKGMQ